VSVFLSLVQAQRVNVPMSNRTDHFFWLKLSHNLAVQYLTYHGGRIFAVEGVAVSDQNCHTFRQ